jgi:DNA-binding transcriptional MerR regulator
MDTLWTLPELVAEVATRIAALPPPKNGQVRAVPDERTIRYYGTIGLLDRPSAMRGRTALYGKKHVAQVVAIKRLQTMGQSLSEIQQLWPTLDDLTLARMSGVELPIAAKPARAEFWKREPRPSAADADADADAAGQRHRTSDPAGTAGGRGPAGASAAGAGTLDTSKLGEERDRPAMPSGLPPARVLRWSGRAAAPGPSTAVHGAAPAEMPGAVELRIELAPHVVLSLSVTDESVVISPADVRAVRAAAAPLLAELASRRLASHAPGEES